ncbi:MAG: phospholipase D-like domain-containing protein [Polyangiaceae bacterium]
MMRATNDGRLGKVSLGLFLLALASAPLAAFGAGCSSSGSNATPPAGSDAGDTDGGGEGDDAGETNYPPSCDPYEPRHTTPELYIGPTGLEKKTVDLINSAEKTIDLSIYEIDTKSIIAALKSAKSRGVTVRVVMDKNQNAAARSSLKNAGITVNDASGNFPYFHVKVMILDGDRALVSSANFNDYSMQGERNYAILDHDKDDIEGLQKLFDNDFAGKSDTPDLSCSRLIVSPVNARERLKELIQSAQTKLDLSVMYITDPEMANAVKERQAAGVAVRLLLANPKWISDNAGSAQQFAAAKVPVKIMTAYDLHAKLIVTERAAFVGSENFSSNSLDQNREVGVFVTNPEPLAAIQKQFDNDWAIGAKP